MQVQVKAIWLREFSPLKKGSRRRKIVQCPYAKGRGGGGEDDALEKKLQATAAPMMFSSRHNWEKSRGKV